MSHTYIKGMCGCRGATTRHNKRGQIYVYESDKLEKVIDYYSDMEDCVTVMVSKDPNRFYDHLDEVEDKIVAANASVKK